MVPMEKIQRYTEVQQAVHRAKSHAKSVAQKKITADMEWLLEELMTAWRMNENRIQQRVFKQEDGTETKALVFIPVDDERGTVEWLTGERVGDDDIIAKVKGEYRISDGYGETYFVLKKDEHKCQCNRHD